ncbi:TonB-dependent receptor [filamentous cyanobacterium LEGE 11480]|uniref:TonB-dependent receptor n=1 Tax=Romeriopsis navalis LEGE 11480 TaxID=2777977 RepID=A0A928VQ57_9CYAN|nr:TonB-dependent receptor [Romeriopsis navalis]MBE9030089.1 TonB-dependent receptor [Romeriopsis navalis LEGE 11480]
MTQHNQLKFQPSLLGTAILLQITGCMLTALPAQAATETSDVTTATVTVTAPESSDRQASGDELSPTTIAAVTTPTATDGLTQTASGIKATATKLGKTVIATPSLPTGVPVMSAKPSIGVEPRIKPTVEPQRPTPATIAPTVTAPGSQTNASAADSVKIITPKLGEVLSTPAATVTVVYPEGTFLKLEVNGQTIDPKLIGRIEQDRKNKRVRQTWYGVTLNEGENQITATATLNDQVVSRDVAQVSVRGDIKTLKLTTVESRIPADGRSVATLYGKLLDAQGNRSNREALVSLATKQGKFLGVDASPAQPGFQVKAENGQFTVKLQSSRTAGTVNVRAKLNQLESFAQVLFETNLRPAIATGVINLRLGKRGTNFYGSLRDFLPVDGDNQWQLDANAAVFTTGKLGSWLFTGAYNSDRPINQSCEGTIPLFGEKQVCENQYPTYGDGSSTERVTPSIDSVYLRLERSKNINGKGVIDYGMWGDYRTGEFSSKSQQFTSLTRQLHGLKLNYNFGNLQVSGLFANNVEGFQRDTIAPDGTRGYYFVSRRLMTEGSESIFFELEELDRPGTVIEREQLQRGADYEIDYDRGTILFRKPVLRTDVKSDGTPLVRRIVTTYQYEEPGSDNKIYAARARYHFSRKQNQESWIGGTYWKENRGARNFELFGADAYIALGKNGSLIAEYARSKNVADLQGEASGSAYRVEAEGTLFKGVEARAFYRSTDAGFANNATVSFVPGQTRYGAQVNAKLGDTTNAKVQFDRENNFGVAPQILVNPVDLFTPREQALPGSQLDNRLTTITAGITQKIGASDLSIDWIHRDRTDRLTPSLSSVSDQLRTRFTTPISKRLQFVAQNETTLSNSADAFYPDRTLVGLDWQLMPGVNLQLAQQFFTRGQLAGRSLTSLAVGGEYQLFPETTVNARYGMYSDGGSWTSNGALGIKQGIQFSPGLRMDLAYERVFGRFQNQTATGPQFSQPFAAGQAASALGIQGGDSFSAGIEYNDSPNFQASARIDHRSSGSGTNTVISAGATGKLSPSLTGLMSFQQASAANQNIINLGNTANLKLGLAYRDPSHDQFNALLRYEYRKNPSTLPDSILFSSGTGATEHLFGAEAIYAPDWRWEFYGKFALRNSRTYLAEDLVGSSTATLTQLRATYRLNYSWDLSGEVRWIAQPSANFSETGFAVEAGYYITPNLRLSGGYAFGRVNDRDFSGSRSAGGPYLGLTLKVNELFNGFGLQKRPTTAPQKTQIAQSQVQSAGDK